MMRRDRDTTYGQYPRNALAMPAILPVQGLSLTRLRTSGGVFGFLSNIVSACSQSHFPASAESLYASYGPRDEEPRHRSVTQCSRRWNLRVSERDVMIVDQPLQ